MNILNKLDGFRALCRYDNPVSLIIQRLFLTGSGLAVYRVQGMTLLADHRASDHRGIRDCFLTEQYQDLIRQMNLPRQIRVLDLGANVGSFSLMVQAMDFSLSHLVAVEMNPQTFSRMQFNLLRNLNLQPVCMCGAVSSEAGFLELEKTAGSTGLSVRNKPGNTAAVLQVPKLTLGEIIGESSFDLCKIDIEGVEYDLFSEGFPAPLKRCRNVLMEIHDLPELDPTAIVQEMKSAGYLQLQHTSPGANKDVYGFTRP